MVSLSFACVFNFAVNAYTSSTLPAQYSSEYNRATWIVNALDAGFASAMSVQPKWLRDICSVIFSIYYLMHGDEADSKVNIYLTGEHHAAYD